MSDLNPDITTALTAAQLSAAEKMSTVVSAFQMRKAKLCELPALHRICRNMIAGELVTVDTMARVEIWSGRTFYLRQVGDVPTAALGMLFLTESGAAALRDGSMSADAEDPDWVARIDEDPAATFVWAVAGETPRDQAAVIRGMLGVWRHVYPDLPTYGRASTPQGMQLMERLGFAPVLTRPGRGQLLGCPAWPGAVAPRRKRLQNEFVRSAAGGAHP